MVHLQNKLTYQFPREKRKELREQRLTSEETIA